MPGELDEPAQRDLAPLAANFGAAQRAHEIARLGAQRLLARRERLELRADAAVRLAPRLVELLHLPLGARERVADRPHEAVDRLLARREVALGALVLHAQALARELQERLGVALELLARELAEHAAHALRRELERALALRVERARESRAPRRLHGELRAQPRVARDAEREPDRDSPAIAPSSTYSSAARRHARALSSASASRISPGRRITTSAPHE